MLLGIRRSVYQGSHGYQTRNICVILRPLWVSFPKVKYHSIIAQDMQFANHANIHIPSLKCRWASVIADYTTSGELLASTPYQLNRPKQVTIFLSVIVLIIKWNMIRVNFLFLFTYLF